MSAIRRIHVVGPPGSGKSTLAARFAERLGCRVFHLDEVAFEGPHFSPRSALERQADVNAIAVRDRWVTEGIFIGWTGELFERADLIIWLDTTTWSRAALRIVRRFLRSALGEAKQQRGVRKVARVSDYVRNLSVLLRAVISSRRYYNADERGDDSDFADRRSLAALVERFQPKMFRCRSAEDVEALERALAAMP